MSSASRSGPFPDPFSSENEGPGPLHLRLDFGALFWRVTAVVIVLTEVWLWLLMRVRMGKFKRKVRLLHLLFYTPRLFVVALLIGGIVAVLVDLFVRTIGQAWVRRWYLPSTDPDRVAFQLGPTEKLIASWPARRWVENRRWQPGSLVRSSGAVWFVPSDWNDDPWFALSGDLHAIFPQEAPRLAAGMVLGVPDHLVVECRDGSLETFAVAEPAQVLAAFSDRPMPGIL